MGTVRVVVIGLFEPVNKILEGNDAVFRFDKITHRTYTRVKKSDGQALAGKTGLVSYRRRLAALGGYGGCGMNGSYARKPLQARIIRFRNLDDIITQIRQAIFYAA